MARDPQRPPTRAELNRALAVNAATKPLNVVVPAAILVAGVLLGLILPLAVVATVAYLALCAATYLDGDEAERVGQRLRSGRRPAAGRPRLDPGGLAPPIAAQVRAALEEESRIGEAVARSDLPLAEVSGEVEGLVRAMERTAERAQSVWEYLARQDPQRIRRRISELEGREPEGRPVAEALRQQLDALGALGGQLDRFYAQMEHIVASLGTMHAQLLRMSVASQSEGERELAGQARELREEVTALAEGMSEVYDRADRAEHAV